MQPTQTEESIMVTAITATHAGPGQIVPGPRNANLPALPWRDPHSVPPEKLAAFIAELTKACAENPQNVDVHTVLGMAHAMNYDVYRSMDALDAARRIDPVNFLAQFKYAELYYRLRALDKAERETTKALELAGTHWELALARRQLSEIRRMRREGTQKPEWTKSLRLPAVGFAVALMAVGWLFMVWK
jgi:cytochrome c-type biogenesis protein CcmH/NrfG